MSDLHRLAELIAARNKIAADIADLIGRPAQLGHVGEYIAAQVFGIALETSAAHKGSDGRFLHGPLAGRSVNVKWSARHDGLLDINPEALPDDYLVFKGPKTGAVSSRGATRPWIIASIFVFDAQKLVEQLRERGIKPGIATSVAQPFWQAAEIYPTQRNEALMLSDEQRALLALFRARG